MPAEEFHQRHTLPGNSYESSAEEKMPEYIGPYQVEALIEKGGMSLLYLATHPDIQDPITIKVLVPSFLSNQEMIHRFLREAEIIGMADHPNIVKLYGQGEWEKGLYIAMEFIQGISLKHYLLHNIISIQQALGLIMEIAMALCHLHAHGVIHRDLKPENILVTESMGIKVIDFGIAQLLSDTSSDPLLQRRLIGTPVYMSPEQRKNPESASFPSDIYSLGIITYELVLRRLSHGQIHLSLMPKGLQKILSKALDPDPRNRYQDIVDFMTDLAHYLHSPALGREKKDFIHLDALSDTLRLAQQALIQNTIPVWPRVRMAVASCKNVGGSSLYFDFISLEPHVFGVLVGEPFSKGTPGVLYSMTVRGMLLAASRLTRHPQELAQLINQLLIEESMKQTFAFSYLLLFPLEHKVRFISCGCGHLWKKKASEETLEEIGSDHPPLGSVLHTQFQEVEAVWQPGDTLFFSAFFRSLADGSAEIFSAGLVEQVLKEKETSSLQEQANKILHKAKIKLGSHSKEQSLFFASFYLE